jgi:DNA-binding protein H-NS
MAKTLGQIQQQIAKLQREAESIRKREVSDVIARIRTAIDHYGLTAQDLFGRKASGHGSVRKTRRAASEQRPARKANPRKGQPVPVKYRDEYGNTWAARGNRPRWLVEALKSGKTLEDFAVKPH